MWAITMVTSGWRSARRSKLHGRLHGGWPLCISTGTLCLAATSMTGSTTLLSGRKLLNRGLSLTPLKPHLVMASSAWAAASASWGFTRTSPANFSGCFSMASRVRVLGRADTTAFSMLYRFMRLRSPSRSMDSPKTGKSPRWVCASITFIAVPLLGR